MTTNMPTENEKVKGTFEICPDSINYASSQTQVKRIS
jgi:hypothetical protein